MVRTYVLTYLPHTGLPARNSVAYLPTCLHLRALLTYVPTFNGAGYIFNSVSNISRLSYLHVVMSMGRCFFFLIELSHQGSGSLGEAVLAAVFSLLGRLMGKI